ncbi:MAG: type II secretion system inner membrane protein GspF [Deltaproteobacteria bacterium]|nr:type II secretion system inner membrane protein GspF [Deltaproteobacteria bacterium]MCB9490213.1 type II secretion system inner membrane protein GspF [Deltaproteobacteria bacterium]
MPVYSYVAMDAKGKTIKGIVDAETEKVAKAKLRKENKFPTSLKEVQEGEEKAVKGKGLSLEIDIRSLMGTVKAQDLAIATRQFATLIGAGIPMDSSLQALAKQVENPVLTKTFSQIRERVTQGTSLANAMKEFPKIFSPLFVNMVNAGEQSGTLDAVLNRLADFSEITLDRQQQIKAAVTYPIFMAIVGAGIMAYLVTFVIPKITQIFEGMDKALPPMTMLLLGGTSFIRSYWWLIAILLGVAYYFFHRWKQTPKGRKRYDAILLRLPIVGNLIRKVAVSRFTRTLGTLLRSGVPIIESLNIVKRVVENTIIQEAIETATDNIREGQPIARPLEQSEVFPPMVIHMITVGEQTGELEEMLFRISDAYDREVAAAIRGMMSVFEPAMLLAMAAGVAFAVMAILLPIMDMTSGLQ